MLFCKNSTTFCKCAKYFQYDIAAKFGKLNFEKVLLVSIFVAESLCLYKPIQFIVNGKTTWNFLPYNRFGFNNLIPQDGKIKTKSTQISSI